MGDRCGPGAGTTCLSLALPVLDDEIQRNGPSMFWSEKRTFRGWISAQERFSLERKVLLAVSSIRCEEWIIAVSK